jgi:hypothetical protein
MPDLLPRLVCQETNQVDLISAITNVLKQQKTCDLLKEIERRMQMAPLMHRDKTKNREDRLV